MIQTMQFRPESLPPGMFAGLGSDLSQGSGEAAGILTSIAPFTGPAAPFVAAAAQAAQLVSQVAQLFSGCGVTCTEATSIVNQAEPYFQQNAQNYLGNPNRTTCDQQLALQTFDQMWAVIVQKCGNAALAAAGQRCISDRQAGSCVWRTSTGACFNWFNGYRDPIANDVPPGGSLCATTSSGVVSAGSIPATIGGIPTGTLGVLLGAGILAWVIMS